jgi:hypothetical protein
MDDPVPFFTEKAKAVQEVAKLGSKALDVTETAGGFLARVLGTIPEDTVGRVFGDWLHHSRLRNIGKLEQRTEELLLERKVVAQPVSASVALPIFNAARDEAREEIQELFARLLAAAMDPSRRALVRREFIEIVKQIEPLDARVLEELLDITGAIPNRRDHIASTFQLPADDVEVSFEALSGLGLLTVKQGGVIATFTTKGRMLMAALSD